MLSDVFGKKSNNEPANTQEKYIEPKRVEAMEPNRKSSSVAVISEDVEFKGVLSFANQLEINGRFEGEIQADGPLVIGEAAIVKASIKSEANVIVRGKLQGNIYAKDKVEVVGNAQMYGDVSAPKFSLAETAIFVGKSDTLGGKPPVSDFANIFTRLDKTSSKASAAPVSVTPAHSPSASK
jgi:cytoskeletal protein CcmA (bactofilin family)